MSSQPRVVKVLVILLISMTTGAIVLMVLGDNPPSAGPFELSAYYSLSPVEKAIRPRASQTPGRWSCVEVYYSGTRVGNIEQLASLSGLASPEDINCHFVICNGLGGGNGQIQTTEKWQRQWAVIPGRTWHGNGQTIRLCVIADGKDSSPTEFQIRRIEELVERLQRKFSIQPESIYYPNDWRQ